MIMSSKEIHQLHHFYPGILIYTVSILKDEGYHPKYIIITLRCELFDTLINSFHQMPRLQDMGIHLVPRLESMLFKWDLFRYTKDLWIQAYYDLILKKDQLLLSPKIPLSECLLLIIIIIKQL